MNTTQTWDDPILAEIYAIRERLVEQYQNDLIAYSQAAETHCRTLGLKIVESPRFVPRAGQPVEVEHA
ncbi:MAG: hypothetical protein QG599_3263 [Pseudomonadota bacterium]|nr:hypothetical protein [Pseudomonadota bacterium]